MYETIDGNEWTPARGQQAAERAEIVTRIKARSIARSLGYFRAARYLERRGVDFATAVYWLLGEPALARVYGPTTFPSPRRVGIA